MDENWNYPPQNLMPGQWDSSPSLSAVTTRAMSRTGIYEDNDPYETQWAGWANAAREDLLSALAPLSGVAQSEIALNVAASGLYDLTRFGVLNIDRVGLGSGTNISWLPWCNNSRAFMETCIPTADTEWAGTQAYRAGGSVIGLAPIPTDTTVQVVVQGGMFPRPLINTTDNTGIPLDLLNLLVTRVAWYACDFDRADAQREKRISGLERDWEKGLYDAKLRILQRTPTDAGMATVYGVSEDDQWTGSRQDQGVSLVPHAPILVPQPMLRLMPISIATAVGTTPVVFTCPVGYPVDEDSTNSVLVFSEEQGYIADVAVSSDRLTITISPSAGQQFYGETLKGVYASIGV